MNINDIKTRARRLANVNSVQWNDTDIMLDINTVYQDLVETIVNEVGEDFFTARFYSDTYLNQSAYDLTKATATVEWHKKIKRIGVRYSTANTYYKVLTEINENSLEQALEYYEDNTSTEDAFFFVKGDKIHIFPKTTEEISQWIRIDSAITPVDLLNGGAEATILIPRQFHNLIVQGSMIYIFQHLGKINEKNDAINNYERLKAEMVTELSDRVTAPNYWMLPDLSYLE